MELTNGLDRGDGQDGRMGTPLPEGAVLLQSRDPDTGLIVNAGTQEEEYDSPVLERAEQATLTKRFRMASWDDGLTVIAGLGRGTVEEDSYGNVFKILSSKLSHTKGGITYIDKVCESVSFDSPPDEFEIVPVELGVNILKYPRYFYALLGDGIGSATELKNQVLIRELQNYFDDATVSRRNDIVERLYYSISTNAGGNPTEGTMSGNVVVPSPSFTIDGKNISPIPGTDIAKAAASELLQKYWRGEETPYVVGYQITHRSFHFRPPPLNPGGYVEDPLYEATPQLPDYFWSTADPPSPSETIFDAIVAANPQCYSSDGTIDGELQISWLRKADEVIYQRTWFERIRTWIGSPVGFWDPELYNADARPSSASDFNVTTPTKTFRGAGAGGTW